SALAITDHDGLYGAMEFAQACKAVGIQPITGAELSMTSGHLTLLAETERGYANLCRLITLAHRNTRVWETGSTHRLSDDPVKPSLTPDQLHNHVEGLIVLTVVGMARSPNWWTATNSTTRSERSSVYKRSSARTTCSSNCSTTSSRAIRSAMRTL